MPRPTALLAALILLNAPAFGQLSPPTIQSSRPIAGTPGKTVVLEVKGTDLDTATALSFEISGVKAEALEPSNTNLKAKVTLPIDAPPGPLRFRVVGPKGHSNAGQIFVGRGLETVAEIEPNNGFRKSQPVTEGAIDGKIEPGDDVDVYAVEMKAGETLVADVIAARAGSGLDALVTVFGPDGHEVAQDDDTFGKDAAVSVRAKVAGRYFVQVQDADGKNRDGKVEATKTRPYRLELGRLALVTSALPAGLKRGGSTTFTLTGANLVTQRFPLDVPASDPTGDVLVRFCGSNGVPLRVGEYDEVAESEPNDSDEAPQKVTVPGAINARLDATKGKDGDMDVYRLVPRAEGTYRVSALAARVGSPADPVLTVLDDKGEAQAENDDAGGRDARLERAIDAKGLLVAVRDYYGRGGDRFVYRLEVEPIAARMVTVTADLGARVVPRGGSVALAVKVEPRGYDGPVTVLAGETPAGVSEAPVTIAKGTNAGLLIVSARDDAASGRFPLRLTARDAAAPVEFVYRERMAAAGDDSNGWLVVADPATLGVRIEPEEITVTPGGKATLKVRLDRRGEAAKKAAVTLRLAATEGNLNGFEPVAEATVAAGSDTSAFELKARPGAEDVRRTVVVLARFAGAAESFAVASGPATVILGK